MGDSRNTQLPSWARFNEDGICVIELNGTHIEVDMTDPDFYERFMSTSEKFKNYKAPAGATSAEIMSDQVDVIDDSLDDLLGDGMAEKLFVTRSLMQRLNFFTVFVKIGEIQRKIMQDYAATTAPRGLGSDTVVARPPRNRKERREAARRAHQAGPGLS